MKWILVIFLWSLFFCEGKQTPREKKKFNTATVESDSQENLLTELQEEEMELFSNLEYMTEKFGLNSLERLESLDALGKFLYHQQRLEEIPKYGKEIVQIATHVHGRDHLQTAVALGNLASVYFKIGRLWECEAAMNRSLRILIDSYGANSPQVVRHRATMMKFGLHNGRTSNENQGISYEEYEEEIS
jgi:tetratricopeptide (TPR) repeat protein